MKRKGKRIIHRNKKLEVLLHRLTNHDFGFTARLPIKEAAGENPKGKKEIWESREMS